MLVCIILAQMATAQTSSFTAAKVDAGQECNWPFNAVATNPADNKVYAFWRKGAGAGATYKLIRWDNPGWTTLSTFTTANGTSSSVKVPDFGDAADKVSLAIDKTGRFHVVFKGIALSTVNDGVWYGTSADGVNWSFQPVDILPASAANESLYDAVIEIDKQNQPTRRLPVQYHSHTPDLPASVLPANRG
ncbi:hypothetical protein [Spirosoma oryzicola]|uniref:hypothetical protein n=1 Tax=Spirosoma oryzicola TaxID=2898794 RepID=UPI001E653098|nr:hypothetical protein [Spirosoma oryzicola]UHG90675.1 hypothetical protein LQ777_20825 [Spirosoma oryzicola]